MALVCWEDTSREEALPETCEGASSPKSNGRSPGMGTVRRGVPLDASGEKAVADASMTPLGTGAGNP